MKDLKALNETLQDSVKIKLVTVDEFKKIHQNTPSTKIDGFIRDIKDVKKLDDGYKITFKNGDTLAVRYDGALNKNNMGYKFNIDNYTGRVRVIMGNYNSSLYTEKIIGICCQWLKNEMPLTFKGLTVNCLDGSASMYTASKLGITPNFQEENLEWTTMSRNTAHGKRILKLYKIMGCSYRFSANDRVLFEAFDTMDNEWIKEYVKDTYEKVSN